jgi:hypothetical protein
MPSDGVGSVASVNASRRNTETVAVLKNGVIMLVLKLLWAPFLSQKIQFQAEIDIQWDYSIIGV